MYILPLYFTRISYVLHCCKFKYQPAPVLEGYFCDFYHKYSPVAKYIFFLKYLQLCWNVDKRGKNDPGYWVLFHSPVAEYISFLKYSCYSSVWEGKKYWVVSRSWIILPGYLLTFFIFCVAIVEFDPFLVGKRPYHSACSKFKYFLKMEELFLDQISCSLINGLLWPH